MRKLELAGERFGMLTVLEETESQVYSYWKVKCDCGTVKTIRGACLTRKSSPARSCGCQRGRKTAHGHRRRSQTSPTYKAWRAALNDCEYQPWIKSFESFLKDVGERPSETHYLNRRDYAQPHDPRNTYWQERGSVSTYKRIDPWDFMGGAEAA